MLCLEKQLYRHNNVRNNAWKGFIDLEQATNYKVSAENKSNVLKTTVFAIYGPKVQLSTVSNINSNKHLAKKKKNPYIR